MSRKTVSASVALSAHAGVQGFATGGIGGVHRGAELTGDISADLDAMAHHPVVTVNAGAKAFLDLPQSRDIVLAFDATSAGAHRRHDALFAARGIRRIDLTPAALGPFVVPGVNLDRHLGAANVNMVTCGGQATIPVVAAISRVVKPSR